MTARYMPIPRSDAAGRVGQRLSLAGSGDLWFDEVALISAKGAVRRPIADLSSEVRRRLSVKRPGLCGLTFDRPRIMGILNVTPDSFSDGGQLATVALAVQRALVMSAHADILDIGGESTRPGAATVDTAEEVARTAPVIRAIRDAGIKTPISIDTRKVAVAEAALEAGADIVNDVSALGYDPDMAALVAERVVPVCLMHAQGAPADMQDDPRYSNVLTEVFDWLSDRIAMAEAAGVKRENIIADPGIGFGKTLQHNLTVLRHLSLYHDLGVPILLGASRKRFIGTIGGAEDVGERMPGSVAVALHGASHGMHILRVHDTMETRQALSLQQAMIGAD